MKKSWKIYRKLKQIILDQDLDIKIRNRTSKNAWGIIEPDGDEVVILKNQNTDQKSITLLHELLHHQYPQVENEEIIENSARRIYKDLPKAEKGFLEFVVSPGEEI